MAMGGYSIIDSCWCGERSALDFGAEIVAQERLILSLRLASAVARNSFPTVSGDTTRPAKRLAFGSSPPQASASGPGGIAPVDGVTAFIDVAVMSRGTTIALLYDALLGVSLGRR